MCRLTPTSRIVGTLSLNSDRQVEANWFFSAMWLIWGRVCVWVSVMWVRPVTLFLQLRGWLREKKCMRSDERRKHSSLCWFFEKRLRRFFCHSARTDLVSSFTILSNAWCLTCNLNPQKFIITNDLIFPLSLHKYYVWFVSKILLVEKEGKTNFLNLI